MGRQGIREKTNQEEFDAFHPKIRGLLRWRRGELKRIKTEFWRRLRANFRSQKPMDEE
jgi:hypothetical protein